MTPLSAFSSDGFMMIALTPAEISERRSAICSEGPASRLASTIFETKPEASASALIEQTNSSRQLLPMWVLETPITNCCAALALSVGPAAQKAALNASMAAPPKYFIASSSQFVAGELQRA